MLVRILALVAVALAATGLSAQDSLPRIDRRVASIGRVDEARAPRIDGRLDDDCWQSAPVLGELVMVEPWEGRQPSQATVVKLLHDRHNLYLAAFCSDDQPGSIRATQRARDARLDSDDRIEILLDPFENRRTAYFFQIGAGGSLGDSLVSANGNRFDKPWDTVWSARARVVEGGWVAEVAIPFRSLPRLEGAGSWGFNFRRYLRERNEEHQWANAVQAVPFFRVSELGTIEGLGEIDAGRGIEFVPYVTVGTSRNRAVDRGDWDFDPDLGGEVYYRLTPSMTLAATAFTDFAETENDSRRINFNRFPLFFPEKRDFFLKGASYFDFGARRAGGTSFLPFFTRRIGLDSGAIVPLLGGIKLTGEAGPFEIGLLDVQADRTATLPSENLGVARLKYAIDEQTTVGLLATSGDPSGTTTNHVLGVDVYHRWPEFVGDMDLQATFDVVGSTGSGANDDGESFGMSLEAQGSEVEVQAGTRWISDDFDPALGFVVRRGSRSSTFEVEYSPRLEEGGAVRNFVFAIDLDREETWNGNPQEMRYGIDQLGMRFHSGDSISAWFYRSFERVEGDFTLFRDSTTVFAGDYWGSRGGIYLQTSEARPWDARVIVGSGDFFDGSRDNLNVDAKWRVSPLLHVGVDYDVSQVDLGPGRSFDAHVTAGRFDLHFSPALSLFNLVQFDNESNNIGWQSRLRWIYAPGCDFFAVLGSSWGKEPDGSFIPVEQALQFKVSHALRF